MNDWNSYFEYLEHWERHDTAKKINNKLLNLVIRANWNKQILYNKDFEPTPSEMLLHKKRFDDMIINVINLDSRLKQININYNPKRIKTIIEALTKIKNYDKSEPIK